MKDNLQSALLAQLCCCALLYSASASAQTIAQRPSPWEIDESNFRPLRGVVLNADDDSPVPLGTVSVGVLSLGGRMRGVTFENGEFSVDVPPSETYVVFVNAEGFARSGMREVPDPGENPITFRLTPLSKLQGRVVDDSGKALKESSVSLYVMSGGEERWKMATSLREDGRFAFGCQKGEYRLEAHHPVYHPVSVRVECPLTDPVDLTLKEARSEEEIGALAGRVTNAQQRPVEEAEVHLRITGTPVYTAYTRTDRQGAYRFDPIIPGDYVATISLKDGEEVSRRDFKVRIAGGGETRHDFELSDGDALRIEVLKSSGEPLATYPISLHSSGSPKLNVRAKTDSMGRVAFHDIAPGRYAVLVHTDQGTTEKEVEAPAEGTIRIRIAEKLTLRATLVDWHDRPVEIFGMSIRELTPQGFNQSRRVHSADGTFVVRGLDPTLYEIGVLLPGDRQFIGTVDLSLGTGVTLVIDAASEGGGIEVKYH